MKSSVTIIALLLLALTAGLRGALDTRDGVAAPEADKTLSPYFVVLNAEGAEASGKEPMPLKSTKAKVTISGVIADVEVTQVYHNTGQSVLEAKYVFPGSTKSAVHGMTMRIGDRVIEAEIKEKAEAKQIYEEAKAENKSASLLEQERPNVFQMSVANILPGDLIEVTLHYTEHLVPTDSIYEFTYPTVVGPRYSEMAANSPAASGEDWVANPYLHEGVEDPTAFDIQIQVNAGMPIQKLVCSTHNTQIHYTGPSAADVHLDGTETNGGNRDFILRYGLKDNEIASGLLLHKDESLKENFFLLTVQPPERIQPDHIPGREYVFVLDVSGSMHGFPLNTAKTLMRELATNLRPTDTFNIMLFSGGNQVLSPTSIPATQANINNAIRWMDRAQAGGGTQLVQALEEAVNLEHAEGMSRSIIVVSDGYIHAERDAFQVIRENLGQANLFSFGIGSSVNRFLVEGLARAGRGEPFVVTDPKQAPDVASKLKEYITSPVLTDVTVDFGDLEVYDVEPAGIPDVLADRPITIFGKWNGEAQGTITLSGISGGGKKVSLEVPVEAASLDQPALPFLWARDRIANLADDQQLDASDETRQQIVNLGLTYNLLTEYTSFVAVDKEVRTVDGMKKETVKQPLPLPQGVANTAIDGGTIPEPQFYLMLAIVAIALWFQRERLLRHIA